MEKFLVDANSFITPYKNYYPFDFAPSFWEQLIEDSKKDSIYLIDLVKDEVTKGDDDLSNWIKNNGDFNICDRRQEDIISKYGEIINYIKDCNCYTDGALRKWSESNVADPWLIAVACEKGFTIITSEVPAGSLNSKNPSSNPKIPDVAHKFNVKCENLFYMMRNLKFNL